MSERKDLCKGCGKESIIVYGWKTGRALCISCNERRKRGGRAKNRQKSSVSLFKNFGKKIWSKRPHYCEECSKYLGEEFAGKYISHILSKGSNPQLYYDERNVNILCWECHSKWEFGNKKEMRIWGKNEKTIALLKSINIL